MALQKIFTRKYRDELFQNVKDSIGLEQYKEEYFQIDTSKVGFNRNVIAPDGLLEKMDPKDDFTSAVALFEAYKDIPTIVAGNIVFWEYLAHTDLFSYVQKRWPADDNVDMKNHVMNHWFVTKGMIRHSLAGLWWAVKCSYDESASDPYELARVLFKNYSFRTTFYGASTLIRCKNATLGILSFLKENPELQNSMELTGRFITNYFNRLGATKQLAYLDRNFFKNELTRLKPEIVKLKNREDILSSVASVME